MGRPQGLHLARPIADTDGRKRTALPLDICRRIFRSSINRWANFPKAGRLPERVVCLPHKWYEPRALCGR
ncbi:hypothetical protein GRAN_3237 [Granulicella sibirica]|uniref:Uncharacterized protein n=1 Tax=Granulicella sibirica TaxID=2479048 RepID=A0A4Q0T1W5_9BACT|nr:hypothetical protein GRAN_3237 [Granulicella sibirica]